MPSPAFLYDDAYITLASAQALWLGADPHFPGTPPLYGVTSPFHCVIVALLLPFLPPLWALLVSCGVGAGAYAAGLWRLARTEGLAPLESAAVVVAGTGGGMISQHLVNGLETSWALAAVVWLLIAARAGRSVVLGVLAATAPFVRPELVVLAGGLLAWHLWRKPEALRAVVAGAAVAATPWLALMWFQLGAAIPSTLAAKRDWYAETCWPATRRLHVVSAGLWGWLLPMPAFTLGLWGVWRTALGRVALGTAVTVLAVWAWSVPNVLHAYQRHRYYAVFLPLLLFGLTSLPRWIRGAGIGIAAAMALISLVAVIRHEPAAIDRAMGVRIRVNEALRKGGATRVLLHDAGYLAFSSAMPVGIDMVGLKTPRAARLHAEYTGPSCGSRRGTALAALALEMKPTHLVIWGPWDDHFGVTTALRNAGWMVTLMDTIESVEPVFVYELVSHAPPKS